MKLALIAMVLFLFNDVSFSSTEKIKALDERLYYPQEVGLNDFIVDVELRGLTKKLKEQKIFGKINEVTFKIYWANGKTHIGVEGLGNGFDEIKKQLAKGIEPLVDSIVMRSWSDILKSYEITEKEYGFKAKDLTGKNEILEYDIKLGKNRESIENIEGRNGTDTVSKVYGYENISAPKKRIIANSIKTTYLKNGVNYKSDVEISRSLVGGHYLPTKIEVTNSAVGPKSKEMVQRDEFLFENYKINTGEATKYILKGTTK